MSERSKLREQKGQALILMVLAMTVIFVIGAIAVDIGLWISERRGAQKDADMAALAGAWALISPNATQGQAKDAACQNLFGSTTCSGQGGNNQQGNASLAQPVVVDSSCFNVPNEKLDGVTVDVNHDTKALFASIFGVVAPEPGAHAKACAGAANGLSNVDPIYVSNTTSPCFGTNGVPKFTTLCGLKSGAQGGTSGDRGLLDLATTDGSCSTNAGSGDIANLILNGAPGICLINPGGATGSCGPLPIYDCVFPQPGDATSATLTGSSNRINCGHSGYPACPANTAPQGLCDSNFGNGNGIDDFAETIQVVFNTGDPNTSIYAPRDCDPNTPGIQASSRLITIIILGQDVGNGTSTKYPIVAFAGFYLLGCADERNVFTGPTDPNLTKDLNKNCADGPGQPAMPPAGHTEVYGQFVNLIVTNAGVGPPGPSTTAFSIALVE